MPRALRSCLRSASCSIHRARTQHADRPGAGYCAPRVEIVVHGDPQSVESLRGSSKARSAMACSSPSPGRSHRSRRCARTRPRRHRDPRARVDRARAAWRRAHARDDRRRRWTRERALVRQSARIRGRCRGARDGRDDLRDRDRGPARRCGDRARRAVVAAGWRAADPTPLPWPRRAPVAIDQHRPRGPPLRHASRRRARRRSSCRSSSRGRSRRGRARR